ncbi:SDR family oxidoreductase [uncultured Thiothrix sp.]|uniref:UDP-glucose 4-epimerase family protein n=1 Tax=uncultured Thiothrix sp. TaxID=223185 RepID=UPI00262859AD|nr:SDR family oxidoreductase [uncultured Thiothrix sp.]
MNTLITGANGFIGQHLEKKLLSTEKTLILMSRAKLKTVVSQNYQWYQSQWLENIHCIIHLAALVHSADQTKLTLKDYRATNTLGTLNLARQAAAAGAKRFIFLSTIKVNGEENQTPYTEKSTPNPKDYYAISKWEAEQGLKELSKETGMEVVIIRPPLVYGSNVKANFLKMMQWVDKGVPLPFGAIHNQRSLIYVDNLVDFIIHCLEHPQAANETFLISDGQDLSTTELLKKLAYYFNKDNYLLPMNPSLLNTLLTLMGKKAEAQRLLGSLTINSNYARSQLNWKPPFSVDEGLARTVQSYQQN